MLPSTPTRTCRLASQSTPSTTRWTLTESEIRSFHFLQDMPVIDPVSIFFTYIRAIVCLLFAYCLRALSVKRKRSSFYQFPELSGMFNVRQEVLDFPECRQQKNNINRC